MALLFSNNILPIFLTAGAGFLLGKFIQIDPRSLSRVIFYLFSPCLIFNLLVSSELDGNDVLKMASLAIIGVGLVGVITWVVGRILKLERSMLTAVLLTSMFANAGNFGLSLNKFAFGETGLSYASLYFVTSAIMAYILGVIIASSGSTSPKEAFAGLVKIPIIYALALGFILRGMNWSLPMPIDRTVTLLGNGAIPSMLVLLGLQLQKVKWKQNIPALITSNVMRLAVSPLIALGLAALLGMSGAARQAGVIESATPSAVLTTVLATEYDVEPSFVTAVVTLTTLLSPLTLTPLLAYLGG